jgi:hypothetical protein
MEFAHFGIVCRRGTSAGCLADELIEMEDETKGEMKS